MTDEAPGASVCQVCGKTLDPDELLPGTLVQGAVLDVVRKHCPDWSPERAICLADLNRCRSEHVRQVLEQDRGELSQLDADVLESIRQQELMARNVDAEFDRQITFGERLADRVAEFGGSWRFIITFGCVLVLWIAANCVALLWKPWDPYPFILLNLGLSCLAALQAPVIMMSQNRQEAKDRLRAENDYRVNLKAELEVRALHAKMDQLLAHQWGRLLEIQESQMDVMQEVLTLARKRSGESPPTEK